jgi:hypothetical protein
MIVDLHVVDQERKLIIPDNPLNSDMWYIWYAIDKYRMAQQIANKEPQPDNDGGLDTGVCSMFGRCILKIVFRVLSSFI